MDDARALLNSLMGADRNAAPEKRRIRKFTDDDICKNFLMGLCPYDLFKNTKIDLGVCEKEHNEHLKEVFESDPDLTKYKRKWRRGLMGQLQRLLQNMDQRSEKNSQRITREREGGMGYTDEQKEQLATLKEDVSSKLKDAERLADDGKFEESRILIKDTETIKRKIEDIELKRFEKYRKDETCEVCGLIIDAEEVEAMKTGRGWHINGKQHIGYTLIRKKLAELEDEKARDRKEGRRTPSPSPGKGEKTEDRKRKSSRSRSRAKKADEKKRQKSRSRSRRRTGDKARSPSRRKQAESKKTESKRPRSRSRSRSKKRSRSRRRRGRSRDKKSRSFSRSKKARSRSGSHDKKKKAKKARSDDDRDKASDNDKDKKSKKTKESKDKRHKADKSVDAKVKDEKPALLDKQPPETAKQEADSQPETTGASNGGIDTKPAPKIGTGVYMLFRKKDKGSDTEDLPNDEAPEPPKDEVPTAPQERMPEPPQEAQAATLEPEAVGLSKLGTGVHMCFKRK